MSSPPPRASLVFAVLTLLPAAGCGSSAPPAPAAAADDPIHIDVASTVASGSEVLLCKFVTMPADRGTIAVNHAEHTFTPGSHHFLVYRTNEATLPAGGDVLVPCDNEGWMSKVQGVAYGAQSPTGSLDLPAGVVQSFTPGEVLLVQVHYLNTTTAPLSAEVQLTFDTIPAEPSQTQAGVFFFFDPIIDVPPQGKAVAGLTCPIPSDVDLVFGVSHMHKRGVGFEAHLDHAAAGSLYDSTTWNEPTTRYFAPGDPLASIKGGSTISYQCSFENADPVRYLAGPSATKNEMCMFIGMYYPKLDEVTENCWGGSAVTTGKTSCLDTLKCVGACKAGDDTCRGACLEDICPTAAEPMMRMARCIQPLCAKECGGAGAGSKACTSCAIANCFEEAAGCQAATCAP